MQRRDRTRIYLSVWGLDGDLLATMQHATEEDELTYMPAGLRGNMEGLPMSDPGDLYIRGIQDFTRQKVTPAC